MSVDSTISPACRQIIIRINVPKNSETCLEAKIVFTTNVCYWENILFLFTLAPNLSFPLTVQLHVQHCFQWWHSKYFVHFWITVLLFAIGYWKRI